MSIRRVDDGREVLESPVVMEWIDGEFPVDQPVDEAHRFGGTILIATVGRLVDQPVHGLVIPANQRGIMAVGTQGSIRALAGDDVERDTMTQAPLPLGSVLRTGAGALETRGIRALLHAVVTVSPGSAATIDSVRRATSDVLRVADESRLRSIALPAIGSGTSLGRLPFAVVAAEIIEAVVAYLRRTPSRIERIVFVTELEEDRALVDKLILVAHQHQWAVPG